jgi:hypothetical protein
MSSNNITNLNRLTFRTSGISIGNNTGVANVSVFLGNGAGQTNPTQSTVAIGFNAGNSNLEFGAVAIGLRAGETNCKEGCICIGGFAGQNNIGQNSIAIGKFASINNPNNTQKTIMLNATNSDLNTDISNAFYVAPVRNAVSSNILYYNTSNKEISYASPPITPPPSYSVVSFTPVLGGFSANTRTGYYQKIGNMVIGSITIFSNIQYIGTPDFITINLPVNGDTYNAPNLAPIGNLYYRATGDAFQRLGGIIYQRFPVKNRMRLLTTIGQNGAGTNLRDMFPTNTPALELIDITFSYLADN